MVETTKTVVDIGLSDVNGFRGSDRLEPSSTEAAWSNAMSEPSEAIRNFRVALVTMPFGPAWSGSIQIGLMKSIAKKAGFQADDYYPNIDLAMLLGVKFYTSISEQHTTFQCTGEWLFSRAAFGEQSADADYFGLFPEEAERLAKSSGQDVDYLIDLRERVIPEFIDDCVEMADWGAYNAVGFTSTFQQHVAALALARRIKEKHPHVNIIFGGSNMDDEMGIEHVRAFPCIDYGVIGEGDVAFPALLTRLAEGRGAQGLPGVAYRADGAVSFAGPSPLFREMDSLPTPDFTTYFSTAKRLGLNHDPGLQDLPSDVPIEGSRGCWWGAKQHCTFCNLSDNAMAYRGRSAERLRTELDELYANHGVGRFWATDAIMDWRVIGPLLTQLAQENSGYQFSFFNLKANMTREQMRILHRGGLISMQAGIESLSTRVLKLMRKGCTKLQNLTCLKWTRYYGISCGWNLLHGFPGEQEEDYADQLATLRNITHFRPPDHRVRVVHLKFSPLFYDDELFPKEWRRPSACYDCIYPEHVDVAKVACYFDCDLRGTLPETAHAETREFVDRWKSLWNSSEVKPALTYRRTDSDIVIEDTRSGLNQSRSFNLLGSDADIYEAFGSAPRTPAQVAATLTSECHGITSDEQSIAAACIDMCDAGLMIGDQGKYLSLALPADPEPPFRPICHDER